MTEEKENPEEAIDPPENQGGGGLNVNAPQEESRTAIDPPENQGGGGQ